MSYGTWGHALPATGANKSHQPKMTPEERARGRRMQSEINAEHARQLEAIRSELHGGGR